MDENIQGVEDNYNDDAAYEAEASEGSGLMGKVLGGLLAVGTIAGGAAIYKNKDAIKAKLAEAKDKKKAKKVQKHLDALAKLGYKEEDSKAETEE